MNPLWFFVGLEIGDRLRENEKALSKLVPPKAKTFVRETYWGLQNRVTQQRMIGPWHRFVHELPTTEERG